MQISCLIILACLLIIRINLNGKSKHKPDPISICTLHYKQKHIAAKLAPATKPILYLWTLNRSLVWFSAYFIFKKCRNKVVGLSNPDWAEGLL